LLAPIPIRTTCIRTNARDDLRVSYNCQQLEPSSPSRNGRCFFTSSPQCPVPETQCLTQLIMHPTTHSLPAETPPPPTLEANHVVPLSPFRTFQRSHFAPRSISETETMESQKNWRLSMTTTKLGSGVKAVVRNSSESQRGNKPALGKPGRGAYVLMAAAARTRAGRRGGE